MTLKNVKCIMTIALETAVFKFKFMSADMAELAVLCQALPAADEAKVQKRSGRQRRGCVSAPEKMSGTASVA